MVGYNRKQLAEEHKMMVDLINPDDRFGMPVYSGELYGAGDALIDGEYSGVAWDIEDQPNVIVTIDRGAVAYEIVS